MTTYKQLLAANTRRRPLRAWFVVLGGGLNLLLLAVAVYLWEHPDNRNAELPGLAMIGFLIFLYLCLPLSIAATTTALVGVRALKRWEWMVGSSTLPLWLFVFFYLRISTL